MKLQTIQSSELFPDYIFEATHPNTYITAAFDEYIKAFVDRITGLACNNTNSFLHCTSEEQRQILLNCGISCFYADASPEIRARFCAYVIAHLSTLSTYESISELIKLIFNDLNLSVKFIETAPYTYAINVLLSDEQHALTEGLGERIRAYANAFFPAHISWNKNIILDQDIAQAAALARPGYGKEGIYIFGGRAITAALPTAFYLKNISNSTSTFTFNIAEADANNYSISTDDGLSWDAYTSGEAVSVEPNKFVYIKGRRSQPSTTAYSSFVFTGDFESGGNIASLLVDSDWDDLQSLAAFPYAFYRLFYNCNGLKKAPDLPFTTLSEGCYYNMFMFCANLEKAPYLPAETGAPSCYRQMFRNCTNLKEIRVNLRSGYGSQATGAWVQNVSSQGVFYRPADVTFWASLSVGTTGVPTNFTIEDL